jgi:hypothetical protein
MITFMFIFIFIYVCPDHEQLQQPKEEGGQQQLYDLSVDRNETLNLASRPPYRQLARALAGLHASWERALPPLHVSPASQATRRRECVKRQQQQQAQAARRKNILTGMAATASSTL